MTRTLRTHLLGLTTAALAVGTLGLTGSPAGAVGGVNGGNISNFGNEPTSVDVAAFGSGDALAAWTREVVGGTRVYAAIATDGVWSAPQQVTVAAVTNAHDVQAVANDAGDLAVVWNQTTGGEEKVRGTRYLGNGSWDGSTLLSPAVDIETVVSLDADIDGAGRVHVAYEAEKQGTNRVRTTSWPKGSAPVMDAFGFHTFAPSLDANPAGQVLLSYRDTANGTRTMVTRRTAALGWLGPKPVEWAGETALDSEAVLGDDGRGAVMAGGKEVDGTRAVVTRVGVTGALGSAEALSAPGVTAVHRHLAISPNGTMQATWTAFENNGYAIRAALAKPEQDFGAPSVADPSTIVQLPHLSLVSDRAAQVVVHNSGDRLTLRHRTNPVLLFSEYDAGATNSAFAADMDREGNVVAAGVVANGFNSYVEADFLDVAGPTAAVTGPGARVGSPSFPVSWQVGDALSGVKSTDVMARTAAWNAGFGPQQVIANNVTTTSQPFAGAFGSTHCFQVQGTDKANNLGFRSEERCTTVPLDDTALTGKKWKHRAAAGAFNDTVTTTKRKGRKLTLAGIHARHLELVVAKAAKGGKVKVTWNGSLLKRISLKGKGSQVAVPLADFAGVQTGTLTIKVTSRDGRKVSIDGLVVAK
ncbi:hypothetical protein ACJ5H2_15175 [Nocardioides sp. R1-1]|uniref:hypothetical protein n=1 Tax=Nocardioides sp. R1-1 TaxID=3383502 RepID=UPI0038CF65D7